MPWCKSGQRLFIRLREVGHPIDISSVKLSAKSVVAVEVRRNVSLSEQLTEACSRRLLDVDEGHALAVNAKNITVLNSPLLVVQLDGA